MRQQVIITLILCVALSFTLAVKTLYFKGVDGHTTYYFLSIFWICGVLIVIFMLNIVWHLYKNGRSSRHSQSTISWPNRRKTYRVIYPNYMRPILFVERTDDQIRRQLEYPILDLSQDGLCFLDDGSLGSVGAFEGHIQFKNGETVAVYGTVLRQQKKHISIQLKHGISWRIILEEQRRLLSQTQPVR